MNFVTWSIRNPVPVIVLFLALTVAGLMSFPKLGVQDQPDIELPSVMELAINRRTATALALQLPQTVLFRADRVIDTAPTVL